MVEEELVARLRKMEKEIQNAQVEVGLREARLAELRPKKQALETECREKFDCEFKDLEALLLKKEAEMETLVLNLEQRVEAAKNV